MGYIIHSRKIIHVVEPEKADFEHFIDRYGRYVIFCIPENIPEVKDFVINLFNNNKNQDLLTEKLKQVTSITDLAIIFTGSRSQCRKVSQQKNSITYKRQYENIIIGVQEGKVEFGDDTKLHYLGWMNERTSEFLQDQFKIDHTKGETINWKVISHGLDCLRSMDAIRSYSETERSYMEQHSFDMAENAPKPADLVKEDD